MSLTSNAATVDLQELCDMLTRSWPEAGSTPSASTVSSDAYGEALLSTDEVADQSDSGEADEKPRQRFSDDAMRVLATCEKLLGDQSGGRIGFSDRESVLREIATLKKRFGRRESRPSSPTRNSIMRHRRYSLGVDARRVLKGWVDKNIKDPYPAVHEKIQLAEEAGLTIKQVNDWFTNFRKRHWEDEMHRGDCN